MGLSLSGSEVDMYHNPKVDTTCRNFLRIRDGTFCNLGVLIEEVRAIKDKNNNDMCFLKVSDATYLLDSIVVFASKYKDIAWIIKEGNPVLISGKKQKESLIVNSIEHL